MTDTIPLYIFSIVNKDVKTMKMEWFVVVNSSLESLGP